MTGGEYKTPTRTPERDRFDTDLQALLESGVRPPCAGRSEWLSEAADERLDAAEACQYCRLLDACLQVAEAEHASWGIYGGRDFAPARPPENKTTGQQRPAKQGGPQP